MPLTILRPSSFSESVYVQSTLPDSSMSHCLLMMAVLVVKGCWLASGESVGTSEVAVSQIEDGQQLAEGMGRGSTRDGCEGRQTSDDNERRVEATAGHLMAAGR